MREVRSIEELRRDLLRGKKIVLDFFAHWCKPCRVMEPTIRELSEELKDVEFVKVDVDKARDLANVFRITEIPTLIVIKRDEEGNVRVGKITGILPKNVIRDAIEDFLKS